MFVKTSVTIVILNDAGKEVTRVTGKASSTFSSGVDKEHQVAAVAKVTEAASATARTAVDGVLTR